ncbi:MAG TPA: ATP-binding protein [Ignavibacteriaceae bacterium]|nr:ATP-binding protein [Ignavibacteriaceae bacterium]
MENPVTINELKTVVALNELPDDHLKWILDHSEYAEYEDGELMFKSGEPIDFMTVMLEGKGDFYMNVNGRMVYYVTFGNDELTGGISGLLPYSRMRNSPGNSIAVGKVRMLKLHKKYFPELENLNPALIQRLIGYMTERARYFATTQMQQEKVSALGKLAAGIAHELNNPAAAIDRISDELNNRLRLNIELTEGLLDQNISPALIRYIKDIAKEKSNHRMRKERLTVLVRMQKEDEINDWLSDMGFEDTNQMAETFIEAGISPGDLDKIKNEAGSEAFHNILKWLENLLSSQLIIRDLEDASERITNLVGAIKSHVHMDRLDTLHYTDLHKDIEDTLILLGYKIRDKNITVKKNFCDNMPEIEVYSGDLNQVWTNIIDNAIYAVPKDGEITIDTSCDMKNVTVSITDNGTGIGKDIINRIFDPFFTTKKVGEGTGIGLDIVKTVITRHNGDVKVSSVSGRTEFKICIPVVQQTIKKEVKDEAPVHNTN